MDEFIIPSHVNAQYSNVLFFLTATVSSEHRPTAATCPNGAVELFFAKIARYF